MHPIARTLEARAPAAKVAVRHARGARSTWADRAAMAAVVVGASVRVEQFLWRRSLWLDEGLVSNNIVSRSFVGLLHPLGGEQGAPIGWLWVQRAMVVVFGDNEYALRIVPLLCGVIALACVYWTARRLVGPWPAALAAWLVALSPQAIRYSVEVKQYSSDLAISAALIWLACEALEHRVIDGKLDGRAVAAWGWVGAVAIWWSHPTVLTLAATATVLAVVAVPQGHAAGLLRACAIWGTSFVVDWVVSLRRLGQDPFLHQFWAAGFPPTPLRIPSFIAWLVRTPSHIVVDPGGIPAAGLGALLALGGLVILVRRRPATGAVVAMPAVVALGAAIIGAYPLDGRLALWLLPVLAIALAAVAGWCVEQVMSSTPRRAAASSITRWRAVSVGVVLVAGALLLRSPVDASLSLVPKPSTFNDYRPLLQAVRHEMHPGDQVWVHSSDVASTTFYALITGAVRTDEIDDLPGGGGCPGNPNIAAVADHARVWFVYGYHGSGAPADEEQALVARFRTMAHEVTVIERPDAHAYLFDFGSAADASLAPHDDLQCVTVAADPIARRTGLTTGPLGTGKHV